MKIPVIQLIFLIVHMNKIWESYIILISLCQRTNDSIIIVVTPWDSKKLGVEGRVFWMKSQDISSQHLTLEGICI